MNDLTKLLASLKEQIKTEGALAHIPEVEEGSDIPDVYELMTTESRPMSITDLYRGE